MIAFFVGVYSIKPGCLKDLCQNKPYWRERFSKNPILQRDSNTRSCGRWPNKNGWENIPWTHSERNSFGHFSRLKRFKNEIWGVYVLTSRYYLSRSRARYIRKYVNIGTNKLNCFSWKKIVHLNTRAVPTGREKMFLADKPKTHFWFLVTDFVRTWPKATVGLVCQSVRQ